jgi:ABC-type sugar transport system substrate-binding protein
VKKFAFILVTFVLVFSLVACNAGNSTDIAASEGELEAESQGGNEGWEAEEEPAETSVIPEDLPHYKIALVYGSFTDMLGTQMMNSMNYLSEAFNVEFVFIESGYGEEVVTAIESALETGLDGILIVGATPAVVDAAQKAGNVPVVMIQAEPTTEEQAAEMASFENYLGAICENDYDVGYRAVEALYEEGARNFCIAGLTKGISKTHDQRAQAAIDFINSKDDAVLLAEDYSMGLWADAVQSFSAAFPEMDGLFVTGGMEAVYQAMRTEGLSGRVKYATIDIQPSTGEYFESGDLAWIAGGQYGTTMVGFAVLYNYLSDGTRIIPDPAVTMYRPFLEVNDYGEYEVYLTYVDGAIPVYTIEEIGQMIHSFSPAAEFEYFMALAEAYSIEDIQTRHAELFD